MERSRRIAASVLGLALESPILLAAGPLSDSLVQIKRALAGGAGAVVTKTIFLGNSTEQREQISRAEHGTFNSTTYSQRPIEEWLHDLRQSAKLGLPVIASVYADTSALLSQLVQDVDRAGVRAIELGLSCPSLRTADLNLLEDIIAHQTRVVRDSTPVPISVKLTAGDNLYSHACIALENGANAITVSDALPAVVVDVEGRRLRFDGPVGYSGAAIKPIVLHAIYQLRRAGIGCPIIGVGGIQSLPDVLEYLQLGCSAVEVMTEAMNRGVGALGELRRHLDEWCEGRHIAINDIIGSALREGAENGNK